MTKPKIHEYQCRCWSCQGRPRGLTRRRKISAMTPIAKISLIFLAVFAGMMATLVWGLA